MSDNKWCTYCRKNDHNDNECWSTRPADWKVFTYDSRYVYIDNKLPSFNQLGLATCPQLVKALLEGRNKDA